MSTGAWVLGAVIVGGGLLLLHNATGDDEPKDKKKPEAKGKAEAKAEAKSKPEAKPTAPSSTPAPAPPPSSTAPSSSPSARTTAFPVGARVEAQDHDGGWYPATIVELDLTKPGAVRWDAGTPGYDRNPKTRTSPASAVRALPGATPPAHAPAPPTHPPSSTPAHPPAPVDAAKKAAAAVLGDDSPLAVLLKP